MADWYPTATKSPGNDAGSFVAGYAPRGVLHTTEGSSATGAIDAYKKNNSWPHFTVDQAGKVYQHIPLSKAARALENAPGGVETNRAAAIQAEVVGFASKTSWPEAQIVGLRLLMRWIEKETGIKAQGPTFGSSEQYGLKNPFEFTNAQWVTFNGWCGHQHVPENRHWDPGAINLATLLPPPSVTVPASYFTEVFVPFTVPRPQGGYIIVGGDGGVFTFEGAPFFGSLPGIGVQAQVAAAAWSPSGNGYWIVATDGAVFGFGDAPYRGGLNGTPHLGVRKIIGFLAKGNGYRFVTLDPSNDGSPFDFYDLGV